MMRVKRYFLEIIFKNYKQQNFLIPKELEISLETNKDYELNKFFYRNIGKEHFWRDRLIWTDKEWTNYINNKDLQTWVLKRNGELIGFYEKEFHPKENGVELINMGILKEFQGNKYGSFLLRQIIKEAFQQKPKRIWVHTCSLDHKYALDNYLSKGFKIFKKEEISFVA